MRLFDVNILVYAHRQDQANHEFYRAHLEALLNGPEAFGLSTLVAAGSPNCYWINPGPQHWLLLSELCRAARASGKRAADAQHAVVAIENACTPVTRDEGSQVFTPDGLPLELLSP